MAIILGVEWRSSQDPNIIEDEIINILVAASDTVSFNLTVLFIHSSLFPVFSDRSRNDSLRVLPCDVS